MEPLPSASDRHHLPPADEAAQARDFALEQGALPVIGEMPSRRATRAYSFRSQASEPIKTARRGRRPSCARIDAPDWGTA